MINLDYYYYSQDLNNLTANEIEYVILVETIWENDGDFPEEYILQLESNISHLQLNDMDFPSLFIESLEYGNINLSDMFLKKGFDINDQYIVDSFIEYCCYNQLDLIDYLLSKGFNLTNKIFNEIQNEFYCGTNFGEKEQSTLDYLSSIVNSNKIEKIMKLKKRIEDKMK